MDHRPKENSVDSTMTDSVTTMSISDEVLSKVQAIQKSVILFFPRKRNETNQSSKA